MLHRFRAFLAQPNTPYPEELARTLYQKLMAPFAEQLAGAELVCIVPHGSLHYLPFHALRDGEQFVVQRQAISYIPSANALLFCREKNSGRKGTLTVFANPKLKVDLPRLKFAAREAEAVARQFPDSEVLAEGQATEGAAFSRSSGRDVVHFATHGELNQWAPLLSCLHLTPEGADDGRLEVHEVFRMNLDAYLVTLSACETALGDLTSGDDLIGLSRAFMYAGTPSVLASLWRVDDEATADLMGAFYEGMAGSEKAASLRRAQLAAIEAGQHPYYWAPFEVIGDWR